MDRFLDIIFQARYKGRGSYVNSREPSDSKALFRAVPTA